jgi:hypothetical protein
VQPVRLKGEGEGVVVLRDNGWTVQAITARLPGHRGDHSFGRS